MVILHCMFLRWSPVQNYIQCSHSPGIMCTPLHDLYYAQSLNDTRPGCSQCHSQKNKKNNITPKYRGVPVLLFLFLFCSIKFSPLACS